MVQVLSCDFYKIPKSTFFEHLGKANSVIFMKHVFFENAVTSFNLLDTGRKLDVHKIFRRGLKRLLNDLCTFNLRPVSRGKL